MFQTKTALHSDLVPIVEEGDLKIANESGSNISNKDVCWHKKNYWGKFLERILVSVS